MKVRTWVQEYDETKCKPITRVSTGELEGLYVTFIAGHQMIAELNMTPDEARLLVAHLTRAFATTKPSAPAVTFTHSGEDD